MILGYTLTTFPKSLIQTQKQQKTLHQIASRRRTLHNWWRIQATGFLHSKETTEQKIRKEEIHNPQNNRKEDNTKFCILFFIYI